MSDVLTPLSLHQVEISGEIGRRIDMTLRQNLLMLDVDRHFLTSFKVQDNASYVAMGKLIDTAVSFAAYTGVYGSDLFKGPYRPGDDQDPGAGWPHRHDAAKLQDAAEL